MSTLPKPEDVGKTVVETPKQLLRVYFPKITVLITTVSREGRANIMTAAWHTPISLSPPIYGVSISPKRYTYELLKEVPEFVVNFPSMDILEKVNLAGTVSGREVDKFKELGLTPVQAVRVRPPLIKECYAHLECRVIDMKEYGDHVWVVGEVIAIEYDEKYFTQELLVDIAKVRPVLYLGKGKYTTAESKVYTP